MTVDDVLRTCRAAGIVLTAAEDALDVDAPRGALTSELRDALARLKPALLDRLAPVTLVALRGGLVVPAPALQLLLRLESRGVRLALASGQAIIEPTAASGRLGPEDVAGIARWRHHLAALIGYRAPTPEWVQ